MSMVGYFIGAVGLGLLALNVVAMTMMIRSPIPTRQQKVAQSILVWLLPVIGALLVLYIIKDGDTAQPSKEHNLHTPSSYEQSPPNDPGM